LSPLTKVKLINELNAREAELGVSEAVSWHAEYKDSAWVFIGGLPYQLTEGDVICVFSQYGEVVNINLVRDKKTGKSKGFCFLCYEDQRSTVLAVDNFNGIKIKGRTIRVDHVANYRPPKDSDDLDDVTKALHAKGCGVRTPPHTSSDSSLEDDDTPVQKQKGEMHFCQSLPRMGGSVWVSGTLSSAKHASRTQRDEEEQRHRRSLGRRGEKSTQEHRGQNGSREERGEVSRKGEGHGSRREECPEGSRSRHRWESSTREPHSKHRERGSTRDSSHH
uniref:RNA-binding motif protein, X-linked 2 n=1 Tax=Meleagris gallopavo TaxID=9103 RepID=G1MSK0_MELGA